MLQRPQSTAEKWLIGVCVGLGSALVGIVELIFTTPDYAVFVRRMGIPLPLPSHPIGYIGVFDLGLVLSLGIGAAIGSGIYSIIVHQIRQHARRGAAEAPDIRGDTP